MDGEEPSSRPLDTAPVLRHAPRMDAHRAPLAAYEPPVEHTQEEIDRAVRVDRHSSICQVCRHADRAEIEAGYLAWMDPKKLARAFGVSLASLQRHTAALDLDEYRARRSGLALTRLLEKGLRAIQPENMSLDDVLRVAKEAADLMAKGDQGTRGWGIVPTPNAGATLTRTWEQTVRASETKRGEP